MCKRASSTLKKKEALKLMKAPHDDHRPHYLRQSGADCIKSQTARLDQWVIGAQGFGVQKFLAFGRRFEFVSAA